LLDQGPASVEVAGDKPAEPKDEPPTGEASEQTSQFDRMLELEGVVETGPSDVDEIVDGDAQEAAHALAMQSAIGHYEELDGLLAAALGRRNDALRQLELYDQGLGNRLRHASDELIEAEQLPSFVGPDEE
jgi:hypothetical protein